MGHLGYKRSRQDGERAVKTRLRLEAHRYWGKERRPLLEPNDTAYRHAAVP